MRTLSQRSAQDAEAFRKFLATVLVQFLRAAKGIPSPRSFHAQPSPNSKNDIMRFTHSMFADIRKTGYIQRDSMALTEASAARHLNVYRAIQLNLYETVDDSPRQHTASNACINTQLLI